LSISHEAPSPQVDTLSASLVHTAIEPKGSLWPDLREIWRSRELLGFLIWRDVRVRYRQTALGAAWVIVQPLMTALVFTLLFGRLIRIPSNDVPYPLFAFSGVLVWSYFAQAVSRAATSIVSSASLVTRVYFPRLIVPLAAVMGPLLDFFLGFVVLLVLIVHYGVITHTKVLAAGLFLLVALATALAIGMWLAATQVRFRDVGHVIPFVLQMWMFASPVAYPTSLVPAKWLPLYSLNPMVGVIEGFRWAAVGSRPPDFVSLAVSTPAVLLLLVGGLIYFKRMERTFADVI
jgi:lipopolysaccharide transport system permease protein